MDGKSLCLHSDIDLLVLFEDTMSTSDERFVGALLQPLWDLGLTVGQHVRELAELTEPATLDLGNAEFLLALLDVRFIAGDERLFQRLEGWVRGLAADNRRRLLDTLLQLVDERHAPFNDTVYQLEPDIKSAPGGLRDIAATRHIRLLRPGGTDGELDRAARQLHDAEDFLQRVRSILHLETGRDVNVLTHELQEKVAEMFGCEGRQSQQRVETLMGEYFRHARASSRVARAGAPGGDAAGGHERVAPCRPAFRDHRRGRALSRPHARRVAAVAVARAVPDCAVERLPPCRSRRSPASSRTSSATPPTTSWRPTAIGSSCRSMLYPRPGLYARLTEMHDCGLLDRVFPEFARIHGRVVRDFYHKYTVDEHTLLAIRNVESLWNPANPSQQRFNSILQELHTPELLTLALLFHDVGKWRDAEHVQESVQLAQSMLDRLELATDARRTVEFLIRNHLLMSQVAFRRDFDDPHVVKQFADLVGSEERLKLLCLMTLADVGAVSPDVLTPWKEDLLWRLYVHAYNRLTLGYADELLQKDPAGLSVVVAGRPDDITEAELTAFLKGLPRRYLTLFGLASIYRHVRLARGIHQDEVHALLERHGDVWELTLVTLDKPFLFSNISGRAVLLRHGHPPRPGDDDA